MIDVFVRVWVPNEVRLGMAISTVARWAMEPCRKLTLIVCEESLPWHWKKYGEVMTLPASNFTRESMAAIEFLATTDIYAGTDDDMLIYGPKFLERGVELMGKHPEYGMVSAAPTNELGCCEHVQRDSEIVESHAIGGPCFLRKGVLREFPSIDNSAYAGHMDAQCGARGLKQGYFRDLQYLHLGSRYSFASPAHCVGY